MLKPSYRRNRITTVIHRELPAVLRDYVGDPRLHDITITTVQLSKRLDYADIYITQLDKDTSKTKTVPILQKAAGRIRHGLSQQLSQFRHIPKLRFYYDDELVKSSNLHITLQALLD